jgi:NAD(P)H-nitrite reductase large subunit
MLNTLFRAPAGLNAITTDETIVCRCEEVTAGEVRAAIRAGASKLSDLKNWTDVGQGPCQGRTCGHLLARQLALENGCNEQDAGFFRARPPIKPIPLGDMAERQR